MLVQLTVVAALDPNAELLKGERKMDGEPALKNIYRNGDNCNICRCTIKSRTSEQECYLEGLVSIEFPS